MEQEYAASVANLSLFFNYDSGLGDGDKLVTGGGHWAAVAANVLDARSSRLLALAWGRVCREAAGVRQLRCAIAAKQPRWPGLPVLLLPSLPTSPCVMRCMAALPGRLPEPGEVAG